MGCLLSVSTEALRGADKATAARILQWASWADSELLPASCAWVFPYLGIMPFNKQVLAHFMLCTSLNNSFLFNL